jgi:beta-lactamase class D
MQTWLERFDYGNRNIAGGQDMFWLDGDLRISALKQVLFLEKLASGKLRPPPSGWHRAVAPSAGPIGS